MPEEMSPGEIGRHLGRIEAQLTNGFTAIRTDLDKYVLQSVHEAEMRGVNERFREIEKDISDAQSRQRAALTLTLSTLLGVIGLALTFWNTLN